MVFVIGQKGKPRVPHLNIHDLLQKIFNQNRSADGPDVGLLFIKYGDQDQDDRFLSGSAFERLGDDHLPSSHFRKIVPVPDAEGLTGNFVNGAVQFIVIQTFYKGGKVFLFPVEIGKNRRKPALLNQG